MQKLHKFNMQQLMDFIKFLNVRYHLQIDVLPGMAQKDILKVIGARSVDVSFNLTLLWHSLLQQSKKFVELRSKMESTHKHYPAVSSLICQVQLQQTEIVNNLKYLNQLIFSINSALPKNDHVHFSAFYFSCCEFLQNLL
jgi:hypothetical protein